MGVNGRNCLVTSDSSEILCIRCPVVSDWNVGWNVGFTVRDITMIDIRYSQSRSPCHSRFPCTSRSIIGVSVIT
jgi:hypothetical protein